jgi:predicted transposase/invertase (TIGR01784 family)
MQTIAEKWKREGIKIGEERGEERGEKRGEKRGKIETARRMLIDGVSIETIIKYTGLKGKEIEKLAASVH